MEFFLSQLNPDNLIIFYMFKMRFTLSYILCPLLANGLLPSGFPTKTFYVFFISHTSATCPSDLTLLYLNTLVTRDKNY
jgi:hypothetical protein